jgi:hypothetical protein
MARALGITLALLTLVSGGARPGLCAGAPARRADARKLLRIAVDACTEVVRSLAPSGRLGDPRYQPLRAAVTRVEDSLADVSAHLAQRDLRFFQSLRQGSRTMAEAAAVLSRTGLQDPEVVRQVQSMGAAYARLRNRYGSEWLRFQTGRPLNAEEMRRFRAMQALQSVLAGRFTLLLEKAQAAGDVTTARELGRLEARSRGIAEALPTLDEVLSASVAADTIEGEYDAIREANPADAPEWNETDAAVGDLRTDPSVGFVFTTDLKTVEQWSYTGVETDVPDQVADADIPKGPGALDEALAAGRSMAAPILVESHSTEATEEVDQTDQTDQTDTTDETAVEMAAEEPAVPEAAPDVEKTDAPVLKDAPVVVPVEPPRPPMRGFLL